MQSDCEEAVFSSCGRLGARSSVAGGFLLVDFSPALEGVKQILKKTYYILSEKDIYVLSEKIHKMAKQLWTPDQHTQKLAFPKLLLQTGKYIVPNDSI